MRLINKFVIHASATKEGQFFDVDDIRKWHLNRGFNDIGYHYVILLDGTIANGRSIVKRGAHVKGFNNKSIGICYIGGLDKNGKPKDTRTDAQKKSLKSLLESLRMTWINAKIMGHRDLSPDKNKDGKISKWEWLKACPCFNAIKEYKDI